LRPALALGSSSYLQMGASMFKKSLSVVASAILFFSATSAHAASLLGKTVTVELSAAGNSYGSQSVLVGAGNDGSYFANTFFDLNGGANGDQFVYSSGGSFCGIACEGGDVVWTLSNLDFGKPLKGFNILQQDVGAITIDAITATSISFRYKDGSIHPGVNVIGQFVTDSAVPEPATWAMMLMGFGLMGVAMRSAKQRKTAALAFG